MAVKTKKAGAATGAPDDEAEVRQLQARFDAVVGEAKALAEQLRRDRAG